MSYPKKKFIIVSEFIYQESIEGILKKKKL